jgi:hypothetical protein
MVGGVRWWHVVKNEFEKQIQSLINAPPAVPTELPDGAAVCIDP